MGRRKRTSQSRSKTAPSSLAGEQSDGHRRGAPEPFLTAYPAIPPAPLWFRVVFPALVALAALSAFGPALDAGFVNWDDDKNITNNPNYRGLTREHLKWMFTTTKMGHWQPLSWITLAVDYKLHGEDHPGGYHLTNMFFHAGGAVAFYFLTLRLLTLAIPPPAGESSVRLRLGAALAALFFAVHPLRVEAVAWVTERRDVLSGLCFIATINAYLISRTAARFRTLWYLSSIGLLGLSVLAKAWGMTMPAILLVLDFYPLHRFARQEKRSGTSGGGRVRGQPQTERLVTPVLVLVEKLPFVVIAVMTAIKAKAAQAGQLDTLKSLAEHGVADRIAQAFYGLAFYVYKTLAPFNLIPIYQIPDDMNPLEPRFIVSALAVVAAIMLLVRLRRLWPAALALAACYVAIFSPVSGIAQSGPQLVKDSYSYLCCLSWAVVVGGLFVWAGRRWGKKAFFASAAALGAIVLTLGVLTWRQTNLWRDSKSLWLHTVDVDPDCWNGLNNLAILVKKEGDELNKEVRAVEAEVKYREAAELYRRSLKNHPKNADALFNRGNCLKAMKDYDGAIASYLAAIEIGPDHAPGVEAARLNLANTYRQLGQLDKSLPLHESLARRKGDPQLCVALGDDLQKAGRTADAEHYYRMALNKRPSYAEARTGLALLLLSRGDCLQAKAELQQALAAEPDYRPAATALDRARSQCP